MSRRDISLVVRHLKTSCKGNTRISYDAVFRTSCIAGVFVIDQRTAPSVCLCNVHQAQDRYLSTCLTRAHPVKIKRKYGRGAYTVFFDRFVIRIVVGQIRTCHDQRIFFDVWKDRVGKHFRIDLPHNDRDQIEFSKDFL